MNAFDFQKATADRILELFTQDSCRHRVLLADEVGLGKTIIAREVVSLMREWRKSQQDDLYNVVYICANINIASQNVKKLGMKEEVNVNEGRLSMQHLIIEETVLKKKEMSGEDMPEIIFSLTPATSFDLKSTNGIVNERALLYSLLLFRPEFSEEDLWLSELFRYNVKEENWERCVRDYMKRVSYLEDRTQYAQHMNAALEKYAPDALEALADQTAERSEVISRLRYASARISVDHLNPDLVIMDEFQRFRNLIEENNSEQSLLNDKFFSQPETRILLLSATPYKPFSTLEEINEGNSDAHWKDFNQVIRFLKENRQEECERFDILWKEYYQKLAHLKQLPFDEVVSTKDIAQQELYGMMCRTERFNKGIVKTRLIDVHPSKEEIASYFQGCHILDRINGKIDEEIEWKKDNGRAYSTVPVEYFKSSPYLMSFMDKYKFKEYIAGRISGKEDLSCLYLPYDKINGWKRLQTRNAKLDFLFDELFERNPGELLLWIPASRPYYSTDGVFNKAKDFSKILIFSAWEMVPRMISVMTSFHEEYLLHKELKQIGKRPGYYFKEGNKKAYGVQRLQSRNEAVNLLLYASPWLAQLYNPQMYVGQSSNAIRQTIESSIKDRLETIECLRYDDTRGAESILNLLKFIDGEPDIELYPVPHTVCRILSAMALASPAVCFLRLWGDAEMAAQIVEEIFIPLFNRSDSAAVLDICYGQMTGSYLEEVLEYCVEGNLQSVIDEYDHLQNGDWSDLLEVGILSDGTLNIDLQTHDGKIVERGMRTSYAIPFTNAKIDVKTVNHTKALRTAFNSPFRPFVLTTTSVGQEGLDFHFYARQLLHWNLPTNPVDMEQREGRVNRFKCLAIRQSLGKKYDELTSWNEIFGKASSDFKKSYSDMVPYWCLPDDFPEEDRVEVERIILQYALSKDGLRYEQLKKVLSLYRLTLGQPCQEELLEMLDACNLTEDQISSLMINLSPFDARTH